MATPVPDAALRQLGADLTGELLLPADPGYDTARAVFNAMIDRRPLAAIRCTDATDVLRGVAFAREHGLALSVRGGGHNVAGSAVADDGLLLDMSGMKGLSFDRSGETVRAEPGLTLGEFDCGHPGARAGHHARRGVDDRDRRAHPGRRTRLAERPPRPGLRQPGGRRDGHRRR